MPKEITTEIKASGQFGALREAYADAREAAVRAHRERAEAAEAASRQELFAEQRRIESDFEPRLNEVLEDLARDQATSDATREALEAAIAQKESQIMQVSAGISTDRLALKVQGHQTGLRAQIAHDRSKALSARPDEGVTLHICSGQQLMINDPSYALYHSVIERADTITPDIVRNACLELLQPHVDSGLIAPVDVMVGDGDMGWGFWFDVTITTSI